MGNVCDRWLGCCCFGGTAKEASLQYVPSKHRNCTDVLFLLLYVASWVGLIVTISVASHRGGDPNKIFHGVDFNGSVCGKSADVRDKPYSAWVAMPQTPAGIDDCTDCYQILTCLSSCNQTLSDPSMIDHYSSQRLMYYCIPTVDNLQNISFAYESQFNSASNLASRAFTDLYTVWPAILIAAFGALLLAFVYAYLSKLFAGVLVAVSIAALLAGGFLMSYALLKYANDADNTTVSNRARAMRGIGIGIAVVTALFLLIVLALRKRIYIAVEVMKEASRAVLDLSWLIAFPIFPFLVGGGYFVLFIVTTLYIASVWTSTPTPFPPYIASSGANTLGSTYDNHSWDESLKRNFAFVFFHLLWTIQFLVYFTFMVIAGAVASWYFTPRDAKGFKVRGTSEGQLSYFPVLAAVYRTMRFHLGTIALGALIIAIIEFVRVVVKYVEDKITPKSGPPNPIQKAVFCLIQCCLACVQCCMDKVSKNALIWCAIYGDSFAASAASSFALVWANLARVAALTLVSAFLMFVGKLFVAFLTTGIAAVAIYKHYDAEVNSLVMPVVVIFLLSYLVAALFMALLETTAGTVLLCFLVDERYNKHSGSMLASAGLQHVIDAHKEEGAAYASREQLLASNRWGAGGAAGAPAAVQLSASAAGLPSQQISAMPAAHSYPAMPQHMLHASHPASTANTGPPPAAQLSSAPGNLV